mmetsp:Transcript_49244/g.141558  ORF Transcript_49244/g.141558 Transcript_49244/m.141558 type:complete len:211 (-) Transcript_49244:580-1212(-)
MRARVAVCSAIFAASMSLCVMLPPEAAVPALALALPFAPGLSLPLRSGGRNLFAPATGRSATRSSSSYKSFKYLFFLMFLSSRVSAMYVPSSTYKRPSTAKKTATSQSFSRDTSSLYNAVMHSSTNNFASSRKDTAPEVVAAVKAPATAKHACRNPVVSLAGNFLAAVIKFRRGPHNADSLALSGSANFPLERKCRQNTAVGHRFDESNG